MKKTFLSLFVVALIVVALAAVPAFADDSQCPAGGDHTWVEQSDATYKCSKCNSTFAEEHIHTPGESVIENVTEATCAVPGSYDTVVYCTTCDGEISRVTEPIDTIAHTPAAAVRENEVAAKCEDDGSYDEVVYCSVCDAEISRDEKTIDATGHTEVTNAAVAPTCTKTGLTEGKHCSVCNDILVAQEEVAKIEHAWDEGVKTTVETCGNAGVMTYTCTDCGKTKTEAIEKLEQHTPGAAVRENEVAAKCEEDGSYDEVVYCSVCNAELSREQKTIPATGHTEVIDEAVAATCTKTGLTEGKHCSVCDKVLVAQEEVAKIEHKWDEGKITKEATTEAEGEKTFTCMGCGATKTEAIAKLDPIPAEAAKPAAGAKPAAKSATPKTGDESNAVLWLVISVSACACGAVTLLAKRKLN